MCRAHVYLLLLSAGIAGCGPEPQLETVDTADRIFLNGSIYTVDGNRSWAEAVDDYFFQMKFEDMQGSVEVGKRADFVVLDRNLFEIPASEISDAQVTMTIFDGRTIYE